VAVKALTGSLVIQSLPSEVTTFAAKEPLKLAQQVFTDQILFPLPKPHQSMTGMQ